MGLRVALIIGFFLSGSIAAADEKYGPDDPVASVNGEPVLLGELNLVLVQRLGVKNLDAASIELQQAAAALLVRRHLVMRSLRDQAGAKLDAIIDRHISQFEEELKRQGSSLEQYARQRYADERSLRADLAWQAVWARYLKSRMTDSNLRIYFRRHRDRYAGSRWDVSQIFVKVDPADKASIDTTKEQMAELAKELRSSDPIDQAFARQASQHSEAGSADQDGRIGWVQKDGDLPSSVMDVIRRMKAGQISDPITSPLGMHLILLHAYEAGEMTFDQLADQSQLRRDAADALFESLLSGKRDAKVVWHIQALRPPVSIP